MQILAAFDDEPATDKQALRGVAAFDDEPATDNQALRAAAESVRPCLPIEATAAQFRSGDKVGGEGRTELHFEALKRLLDRSEADYAD